MNIRIFCYEAKEEMVVRHFIDKIKTDQTLNCHLIEYNLYHTFLSICDDKRITSSVSRMEEKGKDYLLKQMHSIATEQVFVEKIQYEPHESGDVLMLTGVGEVFPFYENHTMLALQPHFSDIPIIVLYPGVLMDDV